MVGEEIEITVFFVSSFSLLSKTIISSGILVWERRESSTLFNNAGRLYVQMPTDMVMKLSDEFFHERVFDEENERVRYEKGKDKERDGWSGEKEGKDDEKEVLCSSIKRKFFEVCFEFFRFRVFVRGRGDVEVKRRGDSVIVEYQRTGNAQSDEDDAFNAGGVCERKSEKDLCDKIKKPVNILSLRSRRAAHAGEVSVHFVENKRDVKDDSRNVVVI